ncbi:uncharacterized protein MYCFIDRAFT_85519 [Pseudocercospora fijiensis CIRAD86]|uniref:Uncharacterized protein n=1 Tax=Pseudocercospora fijiensis (strain CIRAD86) TaxID=383855 RepID=N1QBG3_PSEFD|nr:uncharacterized protein MYCFIDRAFT_85519 [Pseudocercospora fijiensis CIRAD86]EME88478.1 hypothetical protein MYCFIDRAFT_85519 [Pseudocercospora fijiensis CIRAD86]
MSPPNFNIVSTALPRYYDEDQKGYVADEKHKAYLDRLAAAQPDHPSRGNQPFPFMRLSAELRNKIYDLATDVDVYRPKIRPRDGDKCGPRKTLRTNGAKTRHQDPRHQYIFVGKGPRLIGYSKPAKPTPVPGILGANKQVREEALSIYYGAAGNMFMFYGCRFEIVAKWITDTVGKNKCHLHCVIWQGCSALVDEEVVALAAMFLLEQTGLLKNSTLCLCNTVGIHVLCGVNEFVEGLVIDGKAYGETKEELDEMTFAELESLLSKDVLQWWQDTPFKEYQTTSDCPICTPSTTEETAVKADIQ